jgi:hypothetical protein
MSIDFDIDVLPKKPDKIGSRRKVGLASSPGTKSSPVKEAMIAQMKAAFEEELREIEEKKSNEIINKFQNFFFKPN